MTLRERLETIRRMCNELNSVWPKGQNFFGPAELRLKEILSWCGEEIKDFDYYDDLLSELDFVELSVRYGLSRAVRSRKEEIVTKARKIYDETKSLIDYLKWRQAEVCYEGAEA